MIDSAFGAQPGLCPWSRMFGHTEPDGESLLTRPLPDGEEGEEAGIGNDAHL
jgi:hypothetical protein